MVRLVFVVLLLLLGLATCTPFNVDNINEDRYETEEEYWEQIVRVGSLPTPTCLTSMHSALARRTEEGRGSV